MDMKKIKQETLAAVPGIMIGGLLTLALVVPVVVQAGDRLIKMTTLEPETERSGNCGNPDDLTNPPKFAPLPPELAALKGYTQECTPDKQNDPYGPGTWELATNRWLPGTVVVHKGDEVTIEFFGIRGRDHTTQIFRPGYEIGVVDGAERVVAGEGYDCIYTDSGESVIDPGTGKKCIFTVPRGEVVRITLVANEHGAAIIHCHTHGTSMNADLIILNQASGNDGE